MRLALFVEDAAHESFLRGLLARLATEEDVDPEVDVRNAVGGRGSVLSALQRYVRDLARGRERFAEILVVAIDSNCEGVQQVTRAIQQIAQRENYPGRLVCAVPDPHVELWYLADGQAVFQVIQADGNQPELPAHKCERGRYKALLRTAFRAGDIDPPAGGSEYGQEIALTSELGRARQRAADLDAFIRDAKAALRESRALTT